MAKFLHWIFLVIVFWSATVPVFAHPHVWIDARAVIRFDSQGRVLGLTHHWRFDEAFSAWAAQGLDTDGDGALSDREMQELAFDQVAGLAEYDFFTFVGEGQNDFTLLSNTRPKMIEQDGILTLVFELDFLQPYQIINALEIAVLDPEYYVAIDLIAEQPVILAGAPSACSVNIEPPVSLDQETEARLLEIGPDVTRLPPELKALIRDAGNTIKVKCGEGVTPSVPLEREETSAQPVQVRAPPFLAPPAELGLPVAKDGLFGWVNQRQIEFYQALTGALGRLQNDVNAFWTLGILSFLYGVFHAAGPGHGKVVISSYVLASESQVWRGTLMSFAAAMVQSTVAVVLVLIGAQLLELSSSVMSNVSNWFAIGSYGFVVAIGLWLVAKKLISFTKPAHTHHHVEDPKALHGQHAQADHNCGHNHMVTPSQTQGNWRQAAGVVLAVGMRPCSGALVVLVFALSQGVLLAGVGAAYLMGLGTALTVAVLASFALVIKDRMGRMVGNRSVLAGQMLSGIELAGAFAVLGFGLVLLIAAVA